MRPADPRKRPPGGALLLKALPAGRLAREAARALRPLSASAACALRLLRRPDAGRDAARGALLLKALPAGRLPRTARARTRTKPCRKHPPAAPSQQLRLRQTPDVSDVSRDMSPPMQATLRATGVELALHMAGYEFPHFDTGWDANALQCLGVCPQTHLRGHFRIKMPTAMRQLVRASPVARPLRAKGQRIHVGILAARCTPRCVWGGSASAQAAPRSARRFARSRLPGTRPASLAHRWSTFQPAQAGALLNRALTDAPRFEALIISRPATRLPACGQR
jgi:hypothetical protein